MMRRVGKRTGFTLIEMVITITLLGILMSAGGSMLADAYRAYLSSMHLTPIPSQAKAIMERMIRELRGGTASTVTQPSGSGSIQFTNDQSATVNFNQSGASATTIYMILSGTSNALAENIKQNSLSFTWNSTLKLVTISFTIQKTLSGLGGSTVDVPFRTSVFVRN
ncbi:MAG: prepilin-type N-terminal cleavage/methylation domain-containing protein [Magnetococcales bacterium]|nr:prepilin-type N-terminal cleavage/methylation domain-containing protein [Magnetococcales bacterium]